MTPTDDQLNNYEHNRLMEATDYSDKSGGRQSASEIEALMRMVKAKQKPMYSRNASVGGIVKNGRFKGFTESQLIQVLNNIF